MSVLHPAANAPEPMVLARAGDGGTSVSLSKSAAHDVPGTLHLAFSVFLLDEYGRVLLQRRSSKKRLWPYRWSNSCCSHPIAGEDAETTVSRRVREELGLQAFGLERLTSFEYRASFENLGVEHEDCEIWIGRIHGSHLSPCPDEVDAVAFFTVPQVTESLLSAPGTFTPWMTIEWPLVCSRLARDAARSGAL